MMLPWQTAAIMVRNNYRSYLPLARIQPPDDGGYPARLDAAARPLWLGLHLVNGVPLPPDMAADPLTERCRAADRWMEIPLVVAGLNGSAVIAPVLLGRLPQPEIEIVNAEQWLGPQAVEAARTALRLAGKDAGGFFLLPRFAPGSLPHIEGASLGLPLAVAALRLCAGKSMSAGIVMTGKVDEQGNVLSVGHLPEKRMCARSGDYPARLFLYPADNQSNIDTEPLPESLPISHLEDADALLDLLETTDAASIAARLSLWRGSPAEFFSWLNSTTLAEAAQIRLLELARQQGWCVACSDAACSAALDALEPYWEKIRHNNTLCCLLTELFPHDRVEALPASPGLLALVDKCKTQANHRGANIAQWISLSERCLNELDNIPLLAKETTDIRNKIGDEHNAFRFLPSDIPQDWLERVKSFAALAQHPDLGKIYGFLTQHYAFCGTYDEALDCAQISLKNFTDAKNRKRRHIDRIYIFLDSGRPDEARRELAGILGKGEADDTLAGQVARQDDAYVHAAFARLCQSLPHELGDYPVAELLAGVATGKHPWQLWACNCGRLLSHDQPELARRCLEISLDICLADSESFTLHSMALMPLAALYAARLAPQVEILDQTDDVLRHMKRHCADGQLHAPHFCPLFDLPTRAAVLEEVAARTARYFPFNYR